MDSLFSALYRNHETHEVLLKTLAQHRYGLTRKQLVQKTSLPDGGSTNRALKELAASDFIRRYEPFGGGRNKAYYRVLDEYVLFHFKWMESLQKKGIEPPKDYWLKKMPTPSYHAWAGYSFEGVVLKHVDKVLQSMSISGMLVEPSSWQDKARQVDLVLDRADRQVTLCEIKFTNEPFSIDKSLLREIQEKRARFKSATKTKKAVTSALISASGFLGEPRPSADLAYLVEGTELFES